MQVHKLDALQPLHDAPELEAHPTQVAADVAPVVGEYFPAAQSAHTALPVAILYLPATQAVHEPSGPVYPALQAVAMQAVLLELPPTEFVLAGHARQFASVVAPTVVEYFPAAQSVQTALPVAILYLPAAHDEHTPPSGHPVTCTSAKLTTGIGLVPGIEMCRYRPRSGVAHVTSAM